MTDNQALRLKKYLKAIRIFPKTHPNQYVEMALLHFPDLTQKEVEKFIEGTGIKPEEK